MAFPTSPSNGQIYTNTVTGARYIYVLADKAWKILYPDLYYQKSAVDTLLAAKVAKAGDTMSGALAMGTNKITGMGNPTAAQDAATLAYVAKHSLIYGLSSAAGIGEKDRDALYYYLVGLGCFSGWGIGYTGIYYTGNSATPLYLWLPFTTNSAALTSSMKLTVGFANFANSTSMTYTCEILDGGGTWRSGSTTFGAASQEATVTITSKVPCGMVGIRITLPINSSYIGVTHIKVEAN